MVPCNSAQCPYRGKRSPGVSSPCSGACVQILTLAVFHTRHVLLESFKSSGGSSLGGDPSVAATLEAESLGAVALGTLYAKIILQALQISDFTFLARSAARYWEC